jgi:N-acetyl-anhydromuramyl-L-alanine amidase AmpD
MPLIPLTPPLASVSRKRPASLIVLHATAGATASSSIGVLRGKGLGYHYIIARDGKDSKHSSLSDGSEPKIFGCVDPLTRVTFHVGSTIPFPGQPSDINSNSVGISLANLQNRATPEPYTAGQIAALNDLIRTVCNAMPSITHITAHAFVQPWNRSDPQILNIGAIATSHNLQVWQPSAAEIAAHKPKKAG